MKLKCIIDAGEVFLSCNNLTLEQYRTIVLSRALTGAGGCAVSIVVLVFVLLTTKRKAWENLTKRVYLANILYTFIYSTVAIAAVNYSHPPSQESAWCEAMGFILQYSGTLVIVHYCALALSIVLQVTLPVYQAVTKRGNGFRKANLKCAEIFFYLILFLCPLLNSWEPFLPQLPSYGNYGPLCWFRLELTDNCTSNAFNQRFLQAIPFAVVCLGYSVLTSTVSLSLCGMYCRFRMTKIGSRIIRVIPTAVVLVILPIVMMVGFIKSAVHSNCFGSFSTWLVNATATTAGTVVMLMAVGMYVHFPMCVCEQFRRCLYLPTGRNELQPIHLIPKNNPRLKRYSNLDSTVITESTPLKVNHHTPSNTKYSIVHSPVTTQTASLIVHPRKLDHHNNPSHTMYSIAHSPVTTETTPLILHPPKVGYHNDPSHTTYSIVHSPVTTQTTSLIVHPQKVDHHNNPPMILHPPKVGYHNNPSHTMYSIVHSPVTTYAVPLTPCPPKVDHHNGQSHT